VDHPKIFRVLFICIGNSCRSQMAEAFARENQGDVILPSSAGLYPAAVIQPETFEVMAEKQILLRDQRPKPISAVVWESADLLVNMSGAGVLHLLPGYRGGNLVWPVLDPMGQPLRIHRQVRDQIERLVAGLAETLRRNRPDFGR
jgi:arsenate reductase